MAARGFRGVLSNRTRTPLKYEGDGLEWGDWTNPWQPSRGPTIPGGTEREWRAESDGFMTGTEGWALWSVQVPAFPPAVMDTHQEWIKISWDVPFIGAPRFSVSVTRTDPRVSGSSTFSDTRPVNFSVQPVFFSQTGETPLLADLVTTGLSFFVLPATWFFDIQFVTHPRIVFAVTTSSSVVGGLTIEPPEAAAQSVEGLSWTMPSLSCATALQIRETINSTTLPKLLKASGSCEVRNVGGGQLSISNIIKTSPDPLGVFGVQAANIKESGLPGGMFEVSITAKTNSAYKQNPYPVSYRIESDGGAVDVEFASPPKVDDNVLDDMRTAANTVFHACNIPIHDWFRTGEGLDLNWRIDPSAVSDKIKQRLWWVRAVNFSAGAVVNFQRQFGEISVGQMLVGDAGMADLMIVTSPEEESIRAVLETAGTAEKFSDMSGLAIEQTEILALGQVEFSEEICSLTAVSLGLRPWVLNAGANAVEAIEIRPDLKGARWQRAFEGCRGCSAIAGGILAFGAQGLLQLDDVGEVIAKNEKNQIYSVAVGSQTIWADLGDDQLAAFEPNSLQEIERTQIPGLKLVGRAGEHVVMLSRDGLAILSYKGGIVQAPVALREGAAKAIGRSVSRRGFHRILPSQIALLEINGAILDFSKAEVARIVAQYAEGAFWNSYEQIGAYWLGIPHEGNVLEVSVKGRSFVSV